MDILETVEGGKMHRGNYYRIFEGLYNGIYLFEFLKKDNVT